MIELQIEEYCKNCPYFDVTQDTLTARTIDFAITDVIHYLKCKNAEVCKHIMEQK